MRVLLDTHTLIWAVDTPSKLGQIAIATLQDPTNELLVSAASAWEIAIKVGLKRLKLSGPYRAWVEQALGDLNAIWLPITIEYADEQTRLPDHHGDPFDRMLVAQAIVEGIPIVSIDAALDAYGVQRLW